MCKKLLLIFWLLCFDSAAAAAPRSVASWYGESYRNRTMANGFPFNPDALTCASFDYPLGTRLRVRYRGQFVDVTVTDRGPARRLGRAIDLSRAAFKSLAPLDKGLIDVQIEQLP